MVASKQAKMEARHVSPSTKLIIVMVGLPARGKSYITRKLARYLNWLQLETKIFNVGERRRATNLEQSNDLCYATRDISSNQLTQHSAEFFDPQNEEAVSRRNDIALKTLHELLLWLEGRTSGVAIFDATNSTLHRRRKLLSVVRERAEDDIEMLFLESYCFDKTILEKNIRLKLSGPDYAGTDPSLALTEFRKRVKMYETSYEPLGSYEEEHQVPYLRLIDVGRKLIAFNTHGFLTAQTMEFFMNFHLAERQIWLSRNGESEDDRANRIGQHSPLSESGRRYAQSMTDFIKHQKSFWEQERTTIPQLLKLKVWTSMMTQAMQTAQPLLSAGHTVRNSPLLNDLNAGTMAGMTFEEIQCRYPLEMAQRKAHPMTYRWPGPGGEAHADVVHRLRAVILELERTREHILLITHRAVMRVLLTYFEGLARDQIASVDIPLGTLYLVEPYAYGVSVRRFRYDDDSQVFHEYQ